ISGVSSLQCKPMEKLRAFVLREKCAKTRNDGGDHDTATRLLIDNEDYVKTRRSRVSEATPIITSVALLQCNFLILMRLQSPSTLFSHSMLRYICVYSNN
ncbi:hypothetical protein DBV15_06573, partial [Temnothorax longispinosus]